MTPEFPCFSYETRSSLEVHAGKLSSKIIYAHMMKKEFSLDEVVKSYKNKIGFYDKNNAVISSSISNSIDFSKHMVVLAWG